jgi:hypothetical protein
MNNAKILARIRRAMGDGDHAYLTRAVKIFRGLHAKTSDLEVHKAIDELVAVLEARIRQIEEERGK